MPKLSHSNIPIIRWRCHNCQMTFKNIACLRRHGESHHNLLVAVGERQGEYEYYSQVQQPSRYSQSQRYFSGFPRHHQFNDRCHQFNDDEIDERTDMQELHRTDYRRPRYNPRSSFRRWNRSRSLEFRDAPPTGSGAMPTFHESPVVAADEDLRLCPNTSGYLWPPSHNPPSQPRDNEADGPVDPRPDDSQSSDCMIIDVPHKPAGDVLKNPVYSFQQLAELFVDECPPSAVETWFHLFPDHLPPATNSSEWTKFAEDHAKIRSVCLYMACVMLKGPNGLDLELSAATRDWLRRFILA